MGRRVGAQLHCLRRAVKRLAGTPCVARGMLAAGVPRDPPAGYPPPHRRAQVELLAGAQQRMQELVAGEIKQRKMHAARCLELEAAGPRWRGGDLPSDLRLWPATPLPPERGPTTPEPAELRLRAS